MPIFCFFPTFLSFVITIKLNFIIPFAYKSVIRKEEIKCKVRTLHYVQFFEHQIFFYYVKIYLKTF